MRPIYLDCHATTPVAPSVAAAINDAMQACGNASSHHASGMEAARRVEAARASVAALLGATDPSGVVFTSGATEANNLILRGAAAAARRRGLQRPHMLAAAAEHSSILAPLRAMAAQGDIELELIPVRAQGAVRPDCMLRRLRPETVMVAVQGANNEIGVLNDLSTLGRHCGERGVLLHADLCQSFGRVPLHLDGVDTASMSAHKLYGPTGIGAAYARPRVWEWLVPQTLGGGQERGRRAGTLNTHGIVGFGAACEHMRRTWACGAGAEPVRLRHLRDLLLALLREELGSEGVRVNGAIEPYCWLGGYGSPLRLPHNLNVTLVGVESGPFHELARERVCVSAASACKALGGTRSHVLEAIESPDDGAVVRVGLGADNTTEDVHAAAEWLARCARHYRR